jgi:TonB family protein
MSARETSQSLLRVKVSRITCLALLMGLTTLIVSAEANGSPCQTAGQGAPAAQRDTSGQHANTSSVVEILSDTQGVDFGPYMQRVIHDVKVSWYKIIPDSAKPPINRQGVVKIEFLVQPDGSIHHMRLVQPSGDAELDRAAWEAVTRASPFPQLPKAFSGPYLALRFGFSYN